MQRWKKILARLKNEPVAVRTAITAFVVALNTQVLDLLQAIGLESSDLPIWQSWAVDNADAIEKAIGGAIALVIWLGPFGARTRVTPVENTSEVWGIHGD